MPGVGRVIVLWPVVAAVCCTLFAPVASAASSASADIRLPDELTVVERTELSPGVEHLRLARAGPPVVVDVARLAPDAPVSLRAILSNDQVAGPSPALERTSSMCLRVRCIVAVNGDFAAVGSDEPMGGFVTGGQLLRTPSPSHHQLSITGDGQLQAGSFEWSGTLVPTDFQPLTLDGVNVPRGEDRVVLYTPAFGPTTETSGTSLLLRTVEPAGPLRLGQTTLVEVTGVAGESVDVAIPPDGAVLVGEGLGAEALDDLWGRVQSGAAGARVLLRLETPAGVTESIGGSPILLRDGKRWFTDVDDSFTRGRHPRTVVGWNPSGETFLVTIDGRQPEVSVGMTLAEASDLLLALGATEAINLDGGGSTTFVAQGEVRNEPSDVAVRDGDDETIRHLAQPGDEVIGHVERPVATAIAVVPDNDVAVGVDPGAGAWSELFRGAGGDTDALALPARSSTDPGSVPGGGVPALAIKNVPGLGDNLRVAAVAADVLVAAALAAMAHKRRRHGPTALVS